MQITPWITGLAAVQNGWSFAAFALVLAVWLLTRPRSGRSPLARLTEKNRGRACPYLGVPAYLGSIPIR